MRILQYVNYDIRILYDGNGIDILKIDITKIGLNNIC